MLVQVQSPRPFYGVRSLISVKHRIVAPEDTSSSLAGHPNFTRTRTANQPVGKTIDYQSIIAGSNPVTLVWSEVYTDIKPIKTTKRVLIFFICPCSVMDAQESSKL